MLSDGSPKPIANEMPFTSNDPPLDNGNLYTGKKIMEQYPLGIANNPQLINNNDIFTNQTWDDKFSPNLFATWADIYETFLGTYILASAPLEIMRHEQMIKHILFINARVALMRKSTNRWVIGTYSITKADEYGRIIEGTFTRWNYMTGGFGEGVEYITEINEKNNDLIICFQFGNYNVPLFLKIGYLINLRNQLWKFKNVNIRLSILHKIVGISSGGRKILEPFLKDLFNLNADFFPNPIQILDISADDISGDFSFNFKDLSNQIDFRVEYKGNEIMIDIDSITKEIFRTAGFSIDIAQHKTQYAERKTNSQVDMSINYFSVRETAMLKFFEQFEYDFKEKFPDLIPIKWSINKDAISQEKEDSENELSNI